MLDEEPRRKWLWGEYLRGWLELEVVITRQGGGAKFLLAGGGPKDAECAKELKRRTLMNPYNERPIWLDLAHKRLDEAGFAANGWKPGHSQEQILERLVALNLERAACPDTQKWEQRAVNTEAG